MELVSRFSLIFIIACVYLLMQLYIGQINDQRQAIKAINDQRESTGYISSILRDVPAVSPITFGTLRASYKAPNSLSSFNAVSAFSSNGPLDDFVRWNKSRQPEGGSKSRQPEGDSKSRQPEGGSKSRQPEGGSKSRQHEGGTKSRQPEGGSDMEVLNHAGGGSPARVYVLAESGASVCPKGYSYTLDPVDCLAAIRVVGGENCMSHRAMHFGVDASVGCFRNTVNNCVHFNSDNLGNNLDMGHKTINQYICKRQFTELGSSAACHDVHPNADDPNMLHITFASDINQIEGVKASVASIVSSTASPEALTVHILVQSRLASAFKESFGLARECQGVVTTSGVLIRVHALNSRLVQKSVATVSQSVIHQRGAIDTLENFARFYMHFVLDPTVVIYLDADTIVQSDLALLRNELVRSKKTIGFVARTDSVKMDKVLASTPDCQIGGSVDMVRLNANWKDILKKTAYNVGVVAVDLQRWTRTKAIERVEALVAKHNQCQGRLWVGGSQPPMLLAFHNHPENEPDDFIVFDAKWNFGDLGWRQGMGLDKLQKQSVLHWNGKKKPWLTDGAYKSLWQKHRDAFETVMKPYESADGVIGSTKDGKKGSNLVKAATVTTTLSFQNFAALSACPWVEILSEVSNMSCVLGENFGCAADNFSMWVKLPCSGFFYVRGKVTTCGLVVPSRGRGISRRDSQTVCSPGALPPLPTRADSCNLMILTTFFTTKKDWQRGNYAVGEFGKIKPLYVSAIQNQVNVTIIYDSLPHELISRYSNHFVRFHQVNLTNVGVKGKFGVNDVRYFFFERLMKANPLWGRVFVVDAFDVRVGMNPCSRIDDSRLYVGHETDKLAKHPWMRARFAKMGHEYKKWYLTITGNSMRVLNCGITGGSRKLMLRLIRRMVEVISDPTHTPLITNDDVNLNMAALNYLMYTEFLSLITGSFPVHSLYKRFQNTRRDVWFIHK